MLCPAGSTFKLFTYLAHCRKARRPAAAFASMPSPGRSDIPVLPGQRLQLCARPSRQQQHAALRLAQQVGLEKVEADLAEDLGIRTPA